MRALDAPSAKSIYFISEARPAWLLSIRRAQGCVWSKQGGETAQGGVSFEIARQVGASKSSVHRMLAWPLSRVYADLACLAVCSSTALRAFSQARSAVFWAVAYSAHRRSQVSQCERCLGFTVRTISSLTRVTPAHGPSTAAREKNALTAYIGFQQVLPCCPSWLDAVGQAGVQFNSTLGHV